MIYLNGRRSSSNQISMLRRLRPHVLITILFLTWGDATTADTSQLALSVSGTDFASVSLKKYGVNGALLASDISYGDAELSIIFGRIGIAFNRFPGGTIGNFYQWSSGNFACHKPTDHATRKRIAQMNRSMERTKTSYSVNDFFAFSENTGSDFTYVLNAMCATPENNRRLLEHMKDQGLRLHYVEIANEVYSPNYAWAYPTAQAYFESARVSAATVRQYYPHAKVGLVVSPISFTGKNSPGKKGTPERSWPDRLKQFDLGAAHATFGDALVIHIYGQPYDSRFWQSEPKANHDHYSRAVKQFNEKFHTSMRYLEQLGGGKPVWLTEWGVTAPPEKRQGIFRDYKTSAYQALFMASALVSITLEDAIEIANYHNARDLWVAGAGGAALTPVGDVLALFLNAAKHSDVAHRVDFWDIANERAPGRTPEQGLKAVLFNSTVGGELLIVNEDHRSRMVTSLDLGPIRAGRLTVDTWHVVDDSLIATGATETTPENIATSGITLAPFSITRITLH